MDYFARRILYSSFILALLLSLQPRAYGQSCLPEGITFSSQVQIDAFAADYPGCTRIVGDVVIEESEAGDITNLHGLSVLSAFGDYLEIHDNLALENLQGLDNVVQIAGGLNIFGNPALTDLGGLEQLSEVGASLRVAFNHELRDLKALGSLKVVVEDLTITDCGRLNNLSGLDSLRSVGGYLIITLNGRLADLKGLNAVRSIGKGLLIEDNPNLFHLSGLQSLRTIGGNCIIVENRRLQSLKGLEALESIGGNLQIASNPFLGSLTPLQQLRQMKGLLQIYDNTALRSLDGLDSLDHRGITDLAILSCDVLTSCSVASVCQYLDIPENLSSISLNGSGCNFRQQILDNCSRSGPNSSPPVRRGPVFFPNPTSGPVEVKSLPTTATSIEVADAFGRVLIRQSLENKRFDLSDLAAGMYFVKLKTEEQEVTQKIVKLN